MTVRLRHHHVLCSLGFEGKGYDSAFIANMANIVFGQLMAPGGENSQVHITLEADSFCAPCPHRIGLGCASQHDIARLDAAHSQALDLRAGDTLSWGECVERVRARITPDDLDDICEGCQWLPLGMCKTAVAELLAQT